MFAHAVSSFAGFFASARSVFALRDVHGTPAFVRRELEVLGLENYQLVVLIGPTAGQATTVMAAPELLSSAVA